MEVFLRVARRSFATAMVALLSVGSVAACAEPVVGADRPFVRGVNMSAFWHDAYGQPRATQGTEALQAMGADAVGLTVTWYQSSPTADFMAPDPLRTPSDSSIAAVVGQTRARGLQVFLRPLVDVSTGGWRGRIRPADTSKWFRAYRSMMVHYAGLAQDLGVGDLQIGAELKGLTTARDLDRWQALISDVRERFDGRLTYGANWDEFRQVPFWSDLDYIGVSAYFPLAPKELTLAGAKRAWTASERGRGYVRTLEAVVHRHRRPLVFTELGYRSDTTSLDRPFAAPKGAYSPTAQAIGLEAAFQVFTDRSWFGGVFVWQYKVSGSSGGSGDVDHTLQDKPAMTTLRTWFHRLKAR